MASTCMDQPQGSFDKKLPIKCTIITPISLSGDSEAAKPTLLLAFRTISTLRFHSHGEGSMLMEDFVCILL